MLNIDKCSIAKQQITFFCNIYDWHRCHPDPEKVKAIYTMPWLRNLTQLQEFLGVITWLAPFIPNMSENTTTLQKLLCKDREFTWNKTYDTAFHHLKQLICVDVTLCHYDVNCPMEVHVDASLHGLGGALVQDGKPVVYACKALTPTEPVLCQYWERATCHCLWSRMFSHICLWLALHHSHRSQAPQADPNWYDLVTNYALRLYYVMQSNHI